jgi:hypothetical protein
VSATEFRAAGLDRLTPDELTSLDDWVGRLVVRLLTDPQARGMRLSGGQQDPRRVRRLGRPHDRRAGERADRKQRDATQRHAYRLAPRVLVRETESGCRMEVDSIERDALVERIR